MTLVICQTFSSPSRTEVQGIMCEEEPWHVLRINHIMGEKKPKKLSCFFPFLSHPVLGHCSCVDHKLPSTWRERKMRAWSNTWNTLQSCSCVRGVIDDLLQRRGCALWTSCTFLHQSEFDLQREGTVHAIQNWLLWVQMSWMPVHVIRDYLLMALQCLSSIT